MSIEDRARPSSRRATPTHARWLRLLRLLVASVAFVLARPAPAAAETADRIVLVAATRAETGGEAAPARAETATGVAEGGAPTPELGPVPARTLRALQSPRVHLDRKYLRHCALLC